MPVIIEICPLNRPSSGSTVSSTDELNKSLYGAFDMSPAIGSYSSNRQAPLSIGDGHHHPALSVYKPWLYLNTVTGWWDITMYLHSSKTHGRCAVIRSIINFLLLILFSCYGVAGIVFEIIELLKLVQEEAGFMEFLRVSWQFYWVLLRFFSVTVLTISLVHGKKILKQTEVLMRLALRYGPREEHIVKKRRKISYILFTIFIVGFGISTFVIALVFQLQHRSQFPTTLAVYNFPLPETSTDAWWVIIRYYIYITFIVSFVSFSFVCHLIGDTLQGIAKTARTIMQRVENPIPESLEDLWTLQRDTHTIYKFISEVDRMLMPYLFLIFMAGPLLIFLALCMMYFSATNLILYHASRSLDPFICMAWVTWEVDSVAQRISSFSNELASCLAESCRTHWAQESKREVLAMISISKQLEVPGFTCSKCFNMDRTYILAVVGAIFAYYLLFIQFALAFQDS